MKKTKQILAIIVIVILALMYVLSLVFALLQIPNWQRLFLASMGMTIILPGFIWLNMIVYKGVMSRRTLEEGEEELTHGRHNS